MKKGRKFAMAYRTEMGEYIWVTDDAKMMDLPQEFQDHLRDTPDFVKMIKDEVEKDIALNKWKNEEIKKFYVENNIIQPIKPVTQGQRMALVNNIQKAEERSTKDWKKDIPLYASLGIFVIIFICALIFMPELVKIVREGNQEVMGGIQQYEKLRHDNFMKEGMIWKEITDKITYVTNVEEDNKKTIQALKERNDKLEAEINAIKPT
jgi:cell division protein FtsB